MSTLVPILAALLLTVVGLLILRETRKSFRAADLAAERSLPTSNGFAKKVTTGLDKLIADQAATQRMVGSLHQQLAEHLAHHGEDS